VHTKSALFDKNTGERFIFDSPL